MEILAAFLFFAATCSTSGMLRQQPTLRSLTIEYLPQLPHAAVPSPAAPLVLPPLPAADSLSIQCLLKRLI